MVPRYVQAITQFVVLSFNQFFVDAATSIASAHVNLQTALDTAKSLLITQVHTGAILDHESIHVNFTVVANVLTSAALSCKHKVIMAVVPAQNAIVLDLDSFKVTLGISGVLSIADVMIYNANIAAAILQAVRALVLKDKLVGMLFYELPELLDTYSFIRGLTWNYEHNGIYAARFSPLEFRQSRGALCEATEVVAKQVSKNTFVPDIIALPSVVVAANDVPRTKNRYVLHHIMQLLAETWGSAAKSHKTAGQNAYEIITDTKSTQATKNLLMLELRNVFRAKFEPNVIFKDSTVVQSLKALDSKFGSTAYLDDTIESLVHKSMYFNCLILAASPTFKFAVTTQGTPLDNKAHSPEQIPATSQADKGRVIYCSSPGVYRQHGAAERIFVLSEDVYATS